MNKFIFLKEMSLLKSSPLTLLYVLHHPTSSIFYIEKLSISWLCPLRIIPEVQSVKSISACLFPSAQKVPRFPCEKPNKLQGIAHLRIKTAHKSPGDLICKPFGNKQDPLPPSLNKTITWKDTRILINGFSGT